MYGQSKHVQEQLFNHLFLFLYETKNFPRGFIIVVLSFHFVENKKEKKKIHYMKKRRHSELSTYI